ncbi:MAG: hypothetical protein WB037_21765 [Pseudolabrys sp.]
MLKRQFGAALIALFSFLAPSSATLHAQMSPPQEQPSVLAEIRTAIIRSIGAQPETVEIAVAGNILTVLRINSNMNDSTHGGRDNEANAIAPIVSKAISGGPEFKNLTTIRVQYVIRSGPGAASKIIDTIDFRKAPSGSFEFHKT